MYSLIELGTWQKDEALVDLEKTEMRNFVAKIGVETVENENPNVSRKMSLRVGPIASVLSRFRNERY